jgi:hypothetical protein
VRESEEERKKGKRRVEREEKRNKVIYTSQGEIIRKKSEKRKQEK